MGTHFTRVLQSWLPFGRENSIYLNTQDLEALFGAAVAFPKWPKSAGVEMCWERLVLGLMDSLWMVTLHFLS